MKRLQDKGRYNVTLCRRAEAGFASLPPPSGIAFLGLTAEIRQPANPMHRLRSESSKVSHPFFIWTVQRTGGTSLAELLMEMSEHKAAEHEPFNWRVNKPRQFAAVARNWAESKDPATLQSALTAILDERYLIKHCYELHGTPLNVKILQAAAKTDYRHILLLRRDELSRLVSKYIAEANGTWFKDYAAQVYAGIAAGKRKLQPLPVDEIVATYEHVHRTTDRIREVLGQLDVDRREVWYEDIYTGDRETRMQHLNALFQFLDFSPETIAAHQADIEKKIFAGGQNTGNILQFVPNLDAVRAALAQVGYAAPEGVAQPLPAAAAHSPEENASMIFTPEKGFVEDNGLGYSDKERRRCNARYQTFIEPHAKLFEGARVLDLGSYDGRFSFAALECGAASVMGVERRQEFIDRSHFFITGQMRERARFICDDMFEALPKLLAEGERFDVVLCLGVFYEVMDHRRLLQLMTAFEPKLIIVDTNLVDSDEGAIRVRIDADNPKTSLAGVASRGALASMARSLDLTVRYETWEPTRFQEREGLHDYFHTNKSGVRRYTLYLQRA